MSAITIVVQSPHVITNNDGSPMLPFEQYLVDDSDVMESYIQSGQIVVTATDAPSQAEEPAPMAVVEEKPPVKSKARTNAQEQENLNG